MEIEDYFFVGTGFNPSFQNAIKYDLKKLTTEFRELKPARQNQNIVVIGTIPLKIQNTSTVLPLFLILPHHFPFNSPIASIPHPKSDFTFSNVKGLNTDGSLDLAQIFTWVPKKSTLPQLVRSISQHFHQHSPYTLDDAQYLSLLDPASLVENIKYQSDLSPPPPPQNNVPPGYVPYPSYVPNPPKPVQPTPPPPPPPKKVTPEDISKAIDQAATLLSTADDKITEGYNRSIELQLMEHYSRTAQNLVNDFERLNAQLTNEAEQIERAQIPEYQIDPAIDKQCRKKAQDNLFHESVKEVKDLFHTGLLTPDVYIKQIRTLHKNYFQNVICAK